MFSLAAALLLASAQSVVAQDTTWGQQRVSGCEPVAEGACVPVGQWGRKMKQVAPACSNGTCYLCSGGAAAPILNGSSCSCSDGTECQIVSSSGVPVVGPVVGPIVTPGGGGGGGGGGSPNPVVGNRAPSYDEPTQGNGDCPQRGPGESGSRCGGQDLIGYCEDQCGTGDNACCVVVNGVATPECNC